MSFKETKCRLCKGALNEILSLGSIAVSDFTDESSKIVTAPLELCCCECGLVQLRHDVDRDVMYRKYYYKSGLNGSMIKELREVSERLMEYANLQPGDGVLDIGANDGTFL